MWTTLLRDRRPIDAIFSAEPSLDSIELHEVTLDRRGPSLTLRFDLSEFPSRPPQKWAAQGFNKVQLTLRLSEISEFHMSGWNANPCGRLEVRNGDNDLVHLAFENDTIQVSCDTVDLVVVSISGYCDGAIE